MRSDLRKGYNATAKWDSYAAKNPFAGQHAGNSDAFNSNRTGPGPSLDGKGPEVYNPYSWDNVLAVLTFIFDFADGCAAGAPAGATLGSGAGFVFVGPIGVAPGGTLGAGAGCLGGGFGSAVGLIDYQPFIHEWSSLINGEC